MEQEEYEASRKKKTRKVVEEDEYEKEEGKKTQSTIDALHAEAELEGERDELRTFLTEDVVRKILSMADDDEQRTERYTWDHNKRRSSQFDEDELRTEQAACASRLQRSKTGRGTTAGGATPTTGLGQ